MNKDKKDSNKRLVKGTAMMMGCCIAPIIVVMLLNLGVGKMGISLGGSSIISLIGSLICPIMMIGSMFFIMGKDGHKCCSKDQKDKLEE
nr:hypothetical protein [uncultured Niameybacter sp.]